MAADNIAPTVPTAAGLKQIAFIDTSVSEYQTLAQHLQPGVEVVLIDGARDGLAQIAAVLAGRSGLEAVHLFSHGAAGLLQVGSVRLTLANMDKYTAELAAIRGALGEQGDLLVYGCDVAQGEQGAAFVAALAQATGADVAASSDATGSAVLNGDWELEAQHGAVEARAALLPAGQAGFGGVLAASTNFDSLGLIDTTGTSFSAGGWTFTTNSSARSVVADSSVSEYQGPYINLDGPGDRAVFLNLQGIDNITQFTMKAGDNSSFKMQSMQIGYIVGGGSIVTISGWRNGVQVVSNDTVDLAANDTTGDVTYAMGAGDAYYRAGTLTFGSAYDNVNEIRFVFNSVAEMQVDDITVSAPVIPDTTAPVFAGAAVNGTSLVMSYTDANNLDAANPPSAGAFTVMAGGSPVTVNSVSVNAAAKTVTLTLASSVQHGQSVTVAYADPTGGNDANAIQDVAGNDVASLAATTVTNNTPDTTAPVFASAAVNGASLVMSYTDANNLDAANPPSAGAFTVMAGGSPVTVNSVSVDAAAKTVTLTLASNVQHGQSVTVAYADPTGGNDANAIQDVAGNDVASLAATTVTNNTPDTTPPAISGNITAPSNGSYTTGQTLSFTVNFDENVTVTGTDSTLGLTIGSTARSASYASKTASSVTYTYTVQAGDNDLDGIAIGSLSLGTSTIRDAAGNDASLSLAGHLPSTAAVLVDTTAPAVSGNLAVPANATYVLGQHLDFTLTFDENLTVTGTDSTLGLTIGATSRSAAFLSGSGNTVTYRYTVQAGDLDADGIAIGSLALGTSTIRDAAGNDANLSLGGHLPATTGVLVDAIAPAVSGNIALPANATYVAGQQLDFTVTFDENVTVTGTDSTLGLTIGSSARSAAFLSASGNTVTYRYTVQAGDVDADGIAIGSLALGASTIRDATGNDANLSLTGHVPATAGVLVDAQAPAVSGNLAVPANGSYMAGQNLDFTVSFDENVTVTGTDSTLGLTIGSTARNAAFVSQTGSSITYRYTVQAGDLDADGIAIGSLALGGSTIRDAAGNNADLSLTGHLPSTAAVLVDAIAPAISGNITAPANGSYLTGQTLSFTVNFDENVTVTGTDSTLGLTIGSTARSASYASKTASSVTYTYTVQAGDNDLDGIAIGSLSLATSTIRDAAGNDASLSLTGHLPSTAAVLVDATAPAVSGNLAVPANATYVSGQNLDFTVTFDENVTVTGTDSTLGLTVGATARNATFLSGSGNTVTYRYTVQAGDLDADGIAIGSLALGTSTIRDAAGNDANLSLGGHLPATTGVLVDAIAPAVSGNIAVPANATYVAGQHLDFTVTFDENITVTGTDSTLGLTIGSSARSAAFLSASGNTVTYRYTVQAGDVDADGIAVGSLALGASTIRDATGNDANLSLTGHVPATAGVLVDAQAPAVSGNLAVPANGSYMAGQNLDFTVTFDENVTVTGTDSTLGLTIGSTARSAAFVSQTANSVTYRYTVQAGDLDADGIAIGSLSLGSSTIRDAAGNDASLSLAGHVPATGGVLVDTVGPAVNGNLAVPLNGSYAAGQVLSFTVSFGENVTVTGTDSTLGLTIGTTARSAAYASKTANSITYTYTVQTGDNDLDGIAIGGLALGASTIRDAAGNNASLALAGHLPSTAAVLVDTVAPVFVDATVNGATLVMSYTDAAPLDSAHAPAAGAFSVSAAGTAIAVTAVAVDAAARKLTLTLATAVASGQSVSVAYTDPSAGNDDGAIQDAAGNDAASLAATVVLNNTPAPVVTPAPVTSTVDGVVLQIGSQVNSDGSVSRVLTIPVVMAARQEQVGNNTVADIPLATAPGGGSSVNAQVPTGFGMTVSGAAASGTAASSLTDLIREIQAHTVPGSQDQTQLTGGGSGFLTGLAPTTPLQVLTIVPTASGGTPASAQNLVIAGTPAAAGNPYTALVIDTRSLPANSTIELHDVEFAAVIGQARVTGGAGAQNVWGDGAAQYIMLGEDDDILHGGGGNDIIGSAGGNDQIFGDDGDDVVFGGAGNDFIDGGTGKDVLLLAGANRAEYSLRVAEGKLVMTHLHGGVDGIDTVANVETLRFSNATADTSVYGSVHRLVEAYTGAGAALTVVDAMVAAAQKGATLAQIAQILYAQTGGANAGLDDQAWVKSLYQNVFHREADSGGAAFWSGKLAAGMGRADVALAMANSAEKLGMQPADVDFNATDVATLVRMYSALFDRKADAAGLNYWIAAHEAGKSMADIADAFVSGAELSGRYGNMSNAQFIDALYQSALHRQAVGAEASFWVGKLDSGQLDRGDVLLGFANSAEKIGLVGTITTSIETF